MNNLTLKALLAAIVLFWAPKIAPAACHVVTPSGSGSHSGADWNNAMANLPATLMNGDTYYLADGNYGDFNPVVSSGSARTYIKKAIAADHCTDAGWNASTMGSGQAVTTRINFSTTGNSNNITFDGNGTSKQPGCGNSPATSPYVGASDCGIKIDDSGCTGGSNSCDAPILMSVYQGTAVVGTVFRYMEWLGNGANDTGNLREDNFLYAPQTTSPAYWTMQHIYGHDTGCVYWQDYANPTYLVEYSYFWGNWSNPAQCHGQLTYDYGSQHSVFRYNIVRDIEGTAVFTWDDGAHPDDMWIYGNIFYYTSTGAVNGQTGNGDSIVSCMNPGSVCTNVHFYNNTFVNWNYTTGIIADNPGGSYIWENNLMYQLTRNPGGGTGMPGGLTFSMSGSTITEDYNSMIYSGSGLSGSHDVNISGQTPVPFLAWTKNTNETVNFALMGENADWSGGLNLGKGIPSAGRFACTEGVNCVDMDMLGHMRGSSGSWDRGALQLAGTAQLPAPPTALAIVSVN